MPYKIVYLDDARQDIKDAKAWYKAQQNGLQKKFASAVKKTIKRLIANPYAFAIRYQNVRVAHPATFPYGVHFYINDSVNEIIIIAVVHDHRDFQTD